MLLAAVDWLHYLFMIPLALISVFLTLVILVQRGRGGGLTGALGGMGGASAFGTKAGDLFTKVTIGVAFVWIVLAMASLKVLNQRTPFTSARGTASQGSTTPETDPKKKGAGDTTGSGATTTTPPATTPPASGTPKATTPKATTPKSSTPAPASGSGTSEPATPPATTPPATTTP